MVSFVGGRVDASRDFGLFVGGRVGVMAVSCDLGAREEKKKKIISRVEVLVST